MRHIAMNGRVLIYVKCSGTRRALLSPWIETDGKNGIRKIRRTASLLENFLIALVPILAYPSKGRCE